MTAGHVGVVPAHDAAHQLLGRGAAMRARLEPAPRTWEPGLHGRLRWAHGGFGVSAAVLAHQGGWDEALFVLLPLALFAGLLFLANRRASRQQEADEGAGGHAPSATDGE